MRSYLGGQNRLKYIVVRAMSPACPLNLIHWPAEVGGRDFLGPKVEGVAKRFVEECEDVAAGHEDLSCV